MLAAPLIGSVNHTQVPIVVATSGASLSADDQAAIGKILNRLNKVPTKVSAHLLSVAPDRRAAQLLFVSSVSPFDQGKAETMIDNLGSAIAGVPVPPDLQVHLSGQAATNVAVQKQSAKQSKELQEGSILFIIILLLIIFRSLLAPLAYPPAGGAGARHGERLHRRPRCSVGFLRVSFFTQILLIVLILGAGTDYGLFLVFRAREQLFAGSEPKDAVAYAAVRTVGESISASAATVIVALLTLPAAGFGLYHDLGVPLAMGIAVMLLAGLDAAAGAARPSSAGRSSGRRRRCRARARRRPVGPGGREARREAGADARRRAGRARGAGAVLRSASSRPASGGDVTAPAGTDAAKGNAAVAAYFPQSSANPTNVIMDFPTSVWENPQQLATATDGLQNTGVLLGHDRPPRPERGTADAGGAHGDPRQVQSLRHRPGAGLAPPQLSRRRLAAGLPVHHLPRHRPLISGDGHTVQWQAGARCRHARHDGRHQLRPRAAATTWQCVAHRRRAPTPAASPARRRPSTTSARSRTTT